MNNIKSFFRNLINVDFSKTIFSSDPHPSKTWYFGNPLVYIWIHDWYKGSPSNKNPNYTFSLSYSIGRFYKTFWFSLDKRK